MEFLNGGDLVGLIERQRNVGCFKPRTGRGLVWIKYSTCESSLEYEGDADL